MVAIKHLFNRIRTMRQDTKALLYVSLIAVFGCLVVLAISLCGIIGLVQKVRNRETMEGYTHYKNGIFILSDKIGEENSNKNNETAHTNQQSSLPVCSHVDDIAIVGAGVAGSYAAWRMRNANMSISLYEYSDRIGGRCLTVQFPGIPDVNVEMGSMRFKSFDHVLLNRTVHELGLEVVDFELGYGGGGDTLYFLRGKHLRYDQLADEAPYDLDQTSRIEPDLLNWQIFKNYTDVDSSVDGYALPPKTLFCKTADRLPLYRQSRKSFMEKYFTSDTYNYLKDISGWDTEYDDAATPNWLPWSDPDLPAGPSPVKTVKTGFQSIPETMVDQFLQASARHSFHRNHHLKSIRKHIDGHFVLSFQPTQTVRGVTTDYAALPTVQKCAKKVLLAIPRIGLEHLDWEGLNHPEIQDYIKHSLKDGKAGKMYFAFSDTWWRNLSLASPFVVSTTPLRQTYDYAVSNSTGKGVLNPAYPDLYTEIWRDSRNQGVRVPGVDSDESISMSNVGVLLARRMLAAMYNVTLDEIQRPDYAVMSIWDQYPIGASWYTWRSGYIWEDVENKMTRPSHGDDVFIISNTFSKTMNQVWVEGALEIVENTLARYFPGV